MCILKLIGYNIIKDFCSYTADKQWILKQSQQKKYNQNYVQNVNSFGVIKHFKECVQLAIRSL